jgi:hypothetical protein
MEGGRNTNAEHIMTSKQYTVSLVRGTSSKSIWVYATSPQNAAYEATKKNPGWIVKDVRS